MEEAPVVKASATKVKVLPISASGTATKHHKKTVSRRHSQKPNKIIAFCLPAFLSFESIGFII